MYRKNENVDLAVDGTHHVALTREQLWAALNDPEILEQCIRGCEQVERINEEQFQARFAVRMGPVKKKFYAQLEVVNAKPLQEYELISTMDAGIAGKVHGVAQVQLSDYSSELTCLQYQARVRVEGWMGSLGVTVLGDAAKRYMHRFMDHLVLEIERQGNQE